MTIFVALKKADWFVEAVDIRLLLILSRALSSSSVLNNTKALFQIIDLLSQPTCVVGRFLSSLFPCLGKKASPHFPHHMLDLIPELVKVIPKVMVRRWRLVGPRNRLLWIKANLKILALLLQLLQVADGHCVAKTVRRGLRIQPYLRTFMDPSSRPDDL